MATQGTPRGAEEADFLAPTDQAPDFGGFFMPFLEEWGQATGVKPTREYTGGVSLRQELERQGIAKGVLARLEKEGIDLDKNYGRDTSQITAIKNRVAYLAKYQGTKDDKGLSFSGTGEEKFERSFANLVNDLERTPEAQFTIGSERLTGLRGMTTLDKADALRSYLRKNPGKDLNDLDATDLSKIFGVKYSAEEGKRMRADLRDLQDFATSDEFTQYTSAQDILQTGLESQRTAQQNFLDAQRRVNAPGYAAETVGAAFKPAETEIAQYFEAQPGMAESQAALDVGSNEAALGRTGYDRATVELARQGGLAKERLASQKAAAVGQMQQYIDTQNPMEALRYGMSAGQSAMGNLDFFKNRLLQPYAQVFPLAAQNYQLGLTPFTMQQQMPTGPEAFDYAISGAGALGQLAGGVGSIVAGRR